MATLQWNSDEKGLTSPLASVGTNLSTHQLSLSAIMSTKRLKNCAEAASSPIHNGRRRRKLEKVALIDARQDSDRENDYAGGFND